MSSDKFVHRLVLPSVRLSDAGEYTAVAGASMSQGHLTVEGRDVKISEPAERNVTVSSCTLKFYQHSEGLIAKTSGDLVSFLRTTSLSWGPVFFFILRSRSLVLNPGDWFCDQVYDSKVEVFGPEFQVLLGAL